MNLTYLFNSNFKLYSRDLTILSHANHLLPISHIFCESKKCVGRKLNMLWNVFCTPKKCSLHSYITHNVPKLICRSTSLWIKQDHNAAEENLIGDQLKRCFTTGAWYQNYTMRPKGIFEGVTFISLAPQILVPWSPRSVVDYVNLSSNALRLCLLESNVIGKVVILFSKNLTHRLTEDPV